MTKRPLLLTGPYLAMWLWLLVPLSLHGVIPSMPLPDRQISMHLGGWVEESGNVFNLRDAVEMMQRKRRYPICRYLSFDRQGVTMRFLPANDGACRFIRLTKPNDGRVIHRAPYQEFIDNFKREFK
ncbi:MAG: hypothetical protein AAFR39_13545 [Pseudomonadota bacterium]